MATSKKRNTAVFEEAVEPLRKSLYDVLLENMAAAHKNVFIHRLIYVGAHDFPSGTVNNIGMYFKDIIDDINSRNDHNDEDLLSGFLIHYVKYFIHVLDGPEEAIVEHFKLIHKKPQEYIHATKILLLCHNINQRFVRSWMEVSAKPPQLVEKIHHHMSIAEMKNKIIMCITKIYNYGVILRKAEEASAIDEEESLGDFGYDENSQTHFVRATRRSPLKPHSNLVKLNIGKRSLISFPEQQILQFFLETPHLMRTEDFAAYYARAQSTESFITFSWPVQCDFLLRNMFDDEYDPVPNIMKPEEEQQEAVLEDAE